MNISQISKRSGLSIALLVGATGCFPIAASAVTIAPPLTVTATVDGKSGPWNYSSTLNTGYRYGVGDQFSPTVINATSGLDFTAGNILVVTDTTSIPVQTAFGGFGLPAQYTASPLSTYVGELIGTFANPTGAILGTPFAIASSSSLNLTIPNGASQLLLGINDDVFADNSGSIIATIGGTRAASTAVPEPFTIVGTLIGGTAALRMRKKLKSSST